MTKPKPVFFNLMRGLRGCYMPDDSSEHVARTFEEFATAVRDHVSFNEMAWDLDYDDSAESPMQYPPSDSDDSRVLDLLRAAWDHPQSPGSAMPPSFFPPIALQGFQRKCSQPSRFRHHAPVK